jgi:hypothetical protein
VRADHPEELADETQGRPVREPDAAAVTSHPAAGLRWLGNRRRRGIARRRPRPQRLLPGKWRCKDDRLELADLRPSSLFASYLIVDGRITTRCCLSCVSEADARGRR